MTTLLLFVLGVVAFLDPNTVIAVGDAGVLRSTDTGASAALSGFWTSDGGRRPG